MTPQCAWQTTQHASIEVSDEAISNTEKVLANELAYDSSVEKSQYYQSKIN